MTQTTEEQIAIMHPVAGCVRLRTIAEAVRVGKVYTSDVDDAISTLGSQRARALARLVLVVDVSDTRRSVIYGEFLAATATARDVLALGDPA